jgi:predicted transcriptional regulator
MQLVAAGTDIYSICVDPCLTTPLIIIASTEDIHTAATLMKEHSIWRLLVTEDGNLNGFLTN